MPRNVIILGSGPAGLTAAIYCGRADLRPLVFEGFVSGGQPGGQLMTTTEVENFPGFARGILGPELMAQMREQAARFGADFIPEDVDAVTLGGNPIVVANGNRREETNVLIIATGASAQILDLPSVKTFWGKGISACATCDGPMPVFRNQILTVIGGGDSAIEEATFLTRFAAKVLLVHRRDAFRASRIMQDRVRNHPKIDIHFDSVLDEVVGDNFVKAVRLKNIKTGTITEHPSKGVFMAIGHKPNTAFLQGGVQLDEKGYIKVNHPSMATSIPGVFACGDVIDPHYRQAISAAGTGCIAALDVERWLAEQKLG